MHGFFSRLGVIHFQLLETPQDFFIDIVSRNNFLVDNLHVSIWCWYVGGK
jgi:hypothetical protein